MKKFLLIILATFIAKISFAQYPSQNVSLYANWTDPSVPGEPVYGIKYNSIWGWVDPDDNREYAILGSGKGTYFIDVTDPSSPVLKDFIPGRRDSCIWREYKTYDKYVYMISDDGLPNSFQIADMSYLPDSVHVVHDDVTIVDRAHTLFVDGDKLYMASPKVAGIYTPMAVFSLANPESPVLLRKLAQDYTTPGGVHDMYVRNDTAYVSGGFEGLFIFKFNNDNTFTLLGSLTSYPDQGYNHSSALTEDGKSLFFCDEVPENVSVKSIDISDLSNISILSSFKSNEGATPHNPYIINDKLIIAYYQDGVQIFDISNPANPIKTGFFDTDPANGTNNGFPNNPSYQGCWGAYPYLPSGTLLASDMQNGLFILNAQNALTGIEIKELSGQINVSPNPAKDLITISLSSQKNSEAEICLTDVTGKLIYKENKILTSGSNSINISCTEFAGGVYFLKIISPDINYSTKVVRQ